MKNWWESLLVLTTDDERRCGTRNPAREERVIGLKRNPMSCRIDRVVIGQNRVVLRISGRIAGEDVDMLRTLLEEERGAVAIDLKDVLLVDSEAVKLLAVRESDGAKLRNCPAYIREWVTRERAESQGAGSSEKGLEGLEDIEDV